MKKKQRTEWLEALKAREQRMSVEFTPKQALIEFEDMGKLSPFFRRHLSQKLDERAEKGDGLPADALDGLLKGFDPKKIEERDKAARAAAAPTLDDIEPEASKKEKLVRLHDGGRISREQLIDAARRLDNDPTAELETLLVAVNAHDAVSGHEPEEQTEEADEEESVPEEEGEDPEERPEPERASELSEVQQAAKQAAEEIVDMTLDDAEPAIAELENPAVIVCAHRLEGDGQQRIGMKNMLEERLGELGVADPLTTLGRWGG